MRSFIPVAFRTRAFNLSRREKMWRKLFPITLTDYATLKKWASLDSSTGEALAEAVGKYHLPDFSNWQPPAAFERTFDRLENDLRTSLRGSFGQSNALQAHGLAS